MVDLTPLQRVSRNVTYENLKHANALRGGGYSTITLCKPLNAIFFTFNLNSSDFCGGGIQARKKDIHQGRGRETLEHILSVDVFSKR